MKKTFATLFYILFLIPLAHSQSDVKSEFQIATKALNLIKNNEIDKFKTLIDDDILKTADNKAFNEFISTVQKILNEYEMPRKDWAAITGGSQYYNGKMIDFFSIGFPFPMIAKKDDLPDYYIFFVFSRDIEKDKIVGFRYQDFISPARAVEEAAKKKDHLSSFDFSVKNLSWFRIWYDSGHTAKDFVNDNGVYALSGDKKMLKTAKIEKELQEIFELVNSADIVKTDYNNMWYRNKGLAEYVYIRLNFDNYNEAEYGEFSIYMIIDPEENIKEELSGFIVVKHSEVFRYFINIADNKALYEKLLEIAYKDYGKLVEKNP